MVHQWDSLQVLPTQFSSPSSPVTCVVNSSYVNQSTVSIPLSPIVTQSTSVANSVFVTQSAASVTVFGCGTSTSVGNSV